jgi:hypothetical protein
MDHSSHRDKHRAFVCIAETFGILVASSYSHHSKEAAFNSVKKATELFNQFREVAAIPRYEELGGFVALNFALPINQGVVTDKRFSAGECSNCRNTVTDLRFNYETSVGALHDRLCRLCHIYQRNNHQARPQALIERKKARDETSYQPICELCFVDLPLEAYKYGRTNNSSVIPELGLRACRNCYEGWRDDDHILPILGVHVPEDLGWRCELCPATKSPIFTFIPRRKFMGYCICLGCYKKHVRDISKLDAAGQPQNGKAYIRKHQNNELRSAGWPEPHTLIRNNKEPARRTWCITLWAKRRFGIDLTTKASSIAQFRKDEEKIKLVKAEKLAVNESPGRTPVSSRATRTSYTLTETLEMC